MLRQAYEMGLSTLEPTAENLRRYGLSVTLGGADVRMIDMGGPIRLSPTGVRRWSLLGVLKVEDSKGRVLESIGRLTEKR